MQIYTVTINFENHEYEWSIDAINTDAALAIAISKCAGTEEPTSFVIVGTFKQDTEEELQDKATQRYNSQ